MDLGLWRSGATRETGVSVGAETLFRREAGFGTTTLAGTKQGVRLTPTWARWRELELHEGRACWDTLHLRAGFEPLEHS